MKTLSWLLLPVATFWLCGAPPAAAEPQGEVPEPLKPWTGWALWDVRDADSPRPYDDPKKALRAWPSRLDLVAGPEGGRFTLDVAVFNETWLTLPGDGEMWPVGLSSNGVPLAVVERDGRPAVKLFPGKHALAGSWLWQSVPQRIAIPAEIGILSLQLDGAIVPAPVWDAQGFLWLRRDASTEQVDKDLLTAKSHLLLVDDIPMALHVEVELIVAGKSREEVLGNLLPAGWKLGALESPLPVAVDDSGLMKAQVRAGKWTIRASGFRLDPPEEIGFAEGAKPLAADQFVAFQAAPELRSVEITGIPLVDVSQTPFPEGWRQFPVYRWETGTPFRIEERMRGMGTQKPAGLAITRELWLDQDGGQFTFRDRITGRMQQVWRLDAMETQQLGSVRSGDVGQLITRNPGTGAAGVELRERNLDLLATGRSANRGSMPATGWRTDAGSAEVTLNLPPGWRLFALFGADWVNGDWLTQWSLLDLFLLLLFSLAVFRLWGLGAALLAFAAFGISCHEPGAPKYLWLLLLIPLALLRVVPEGWAKRLTLAVKWLLVLSLVIVMVPFAGRQIQQALYPQLEELPYGSLFGRAVIASYNAPGAPQDFAAKAMAEMDVDPFAADESLRGRLQQREAKDAQNLQYDVKARIQTGPGVPDWQWRSVSFGWNGPVTEQQTVRPVLIPAWLGRVISLTRVLLLVGLAFVLLGWRRRPKPAAPPASGETPAAATAVAVLLLGVLALPAARADEIPDKEMLETLRARLTEVPDAFPNAADIPHVALSLREDELAMDAEIHVAAPCAVPLPCRLPAWSPVSVTVNGEPAAALRRDDGFLWVALPVGVHQVRMTGVPAKATEWQWTWKLRPRRVTIDAPGWQIGGVKPGGVPEAQVFFTREVASTEGGADYDRPNLQSVVTVERTIQLGLVWQVSSHVGRITPGGGAVSLLVPLLPGESVITPGAVVRDGFIEVRLGSGQDHFAWDSELATGNRIELQSRSSDTWVEHWLLEASPVWNVGISGLAPFFDEEDGSLTPQWRPWPGEGAVLEIGRPEAVTGATATIDRATHEISLGKRRRTSTLTLSLRSTLGDDFLIGLPPGAEPTSILSNGGKLPVRRDGDRVIVPLVPGSQEIVLQWDQDAPLGLHTVVPAVELPVEWANLTTTLSVPDDRWVLWAHGPLRGPAVRFWGILIGSLLAAWVLGRLRQSPLRTHEWMLLAVGLTQIPLPGALMVVAWLFALSWRGSPTFPSLHPVSHNALQVILALASLIVLGIFVGVVAAGLLGDPEMFIRGNDSSRTLLRWFEARGEGALPLPGTVSVSIWWYRLFMLLWALWLAASLIRWLTRGWSQFNAGGCFRRSAKAVQPPPLKAG